MPDAISVNLGPREVLARYQRAILDKADPEQPDRADS